MNDHYVWLIWASAFLIPWLVIYGGLPHFRAQMLTASLWTALLGLTEPLFVPSYWNPPSLFWLAQRTGFDLESLILGFAFGGIGIVLYHMPLEELLFGFSFGMYWSGVYEHFTWTQSAAGAVLKD